MESGPLKQWEKRVGTDKTPMPDLARYEENLSTALDTAL